MVEIDVVSVTPGMLQLPCAGAEAAVSVRRSGRRSGLVLVPLPSIYVNLGKFSTSSIFSSTQVAKCALWSGVDCRGLLLPGVF